MSVAYKQTPEYKHYIELLGLSRGELEDKRIELNELLKVRRAATATATHKAKAAEADLDAALNAEDEVTQELRLVFRAIEQQQRDQSAVKMMDRAQMLGKRD